MKRKIITTAASALCAFCVCYCERLQFLPLRSGAFIIRAAACLILSAAAGYAVGALFASCFPKQSAKQNTCILLCSLFAAFFLLVWLPIPLTGILGKQTLTIRPLDDRPLTLTWLHTGLGDARLKDFSCSGECTLDESGLTLYGKDSYAQWSGLGGDQATLEFIAGTDRGAARFQWGKRSLDISLFRDDMPRLSYDTAFLPADQLPELAAAFILLFLLITAAALWIFCTKAHLSVPVFFTAAALIFLIFRVCQFRTITTPLTFVDSESYLGTAAMPIRDILKGVPYCYPNMDYCITRQAVIPLIFKLCRLVPERICIFQICFSVICWIAAVWYLQSCFDRSRIRKAAVILTFGLGCIPNITRWDGMIMTESVTISLSVLFFALLCRAVRSKRLRDIVFMIIVGLILIPTRDSSSWTVLLGAVGLLLVFFLKKTGRKPLAAAVIILIAGCLLSMGSAGDRWKFPFENVLFVRIMRDSRATAFFVENGMPMPQGIEELYGTEHLQGSELFNSDGFQGLREWIVKDGLKVYFRYLLTTAPDTLRLTADEFLNEGFKQTSYRFSPKDFRSLLPEPLTEFFSWNLPEIAVILTGFAGIIGIIFSKKGHDWVIPTIFLLSTYILVSAVFLIDEYDFPRHALINFLLMKISVCMLILRLSETIGDKYDPGK